VRAQVDATGSRGPAPAAPSRSGPHRIVIVGGGAGGLELAVRLGESLRGSGAAEVTLIDIGMTHVWKPLLHELAAGTLDLRESEVEFLQQAQVHNFRFHLGRVESVERGARQVWLGPLLDDEGIAIAPRRAIGYDTLVLALGSVVNDFGTPGVARHANRLNTAADARRFHRRLLAQCARAEAQSDGPVHVVVVGGGATGVELAAELVESARELARYGERLGALEQPVRVTVVESGQRLVSALPEAASEQVLRRLAAMGVSVRLGQPVSEVDATQVRLKSGEVLPAHLTVWAAGIQGPSSLESLGDFELNRQRQIVVRPTLQTTVDDDIFAIGDCASCTPRAGEPPVPPRAQAAHQEAAFLVGAMRHRLAGRPLPSFEFHERGSLVSLGRRTAVGNVVGLLSGRAWNVRGWLARWAYWGLQRQHMATLQGVLRTVLATIAGWLSARAHPRVKLH
jgi:NADH dehydrogenase